MKKMRRDNNVTNCTSVTGTENEIELSWLIEQGVIWDEKDLPNRVGAVYTENETKLSWLMGRGAI